MSRRLVPGATAAPMTTTFKRADQLRQQEATLVRFLVGVFSSSLSSLQSFPGLRKLLNLTDAAAQPVEQPFRAAPGRRLRAVSGKTAGGKAGARAANRKAAGGKAAGAKAAKEVQSQLPLDIECIATLYTPVPEQPAKSDESAAGSKAGGNAGGKAAVGRGSGKTFAGKPVGRSGKARSLKTVAG